MFGEEGVQVPKHGEVLQRATEFNPELKAVDGDAFKSNLRLMLGIDPKPDGRYYRNEIFEKNAEYQGIATELIDKLTERIANKPITILHLADTISSVLLEIEKDKKTGGNEGFKNASESFHKVGIAIMAPFILEAWDLHPDEQDIAVKTIIDKVIDDRHKTPQPLSEKYRVKTGSIN